MAMGPRRRAIITGALVLGSLVAAPPSEGQDQDPALNLYFVANGAYNRKLYPAAIGGFNEFLQKHPNHPKADMARQGLSLSFYAQKQYAQAIPQLAALLAKANLSPEIKRDRLIMLQGQCLLRSGKKDEAKAMFVAEHGRLQDPAFKAAALAVICDISFGKREWEEVRKWTASLLGTKVTPDQAGRGLYQQGFANHQLKKYPEAIAALAKVEATGADAIWKTRAAYLLGECHTIGKSYDKAEPAYVAALLGLTGADLAECHWRLGVTRFILEKWESAATEFEAFLVEEQKSRPADQKVENPRVMEARLYIGRCYLQRDDFKQAEPRLNALIGLKGPTAAKANLWFARVFTRQERPNYDRAADVLKVAVDPFKSAPVINELRFDYANALMSRKVPDWKTAAQVLQQINLGAFKQAAEVFAQRATCYHKLKNYAQSVQIADQYLAQFATHNLAGDTRFLRAENLFLMNQPDPAAKAYQDFLAAHKDHPLVMAASFRIAQIHHHQGRWDQALASALPLLAKKPEGRLFAQLSFVVGDSLFRQEKWKEALQPLEDFIATRVDKKNKNAQKVSIDPNVDTALMQLAVSYDRTEQPVKALEHLETLARFYPQPTPQLPLALAEQGRLAYQQENLPLARQALERFLTEDKLNKEPFNKTAPPQRPRVHYYLGWINSAEKKYEPAAVHFGEVAKIPKHELAPDAALQQGIAYVSAEKYDEASKHFPAMLGRYPQHEKIQRVTYYAGLSLARQKQWGPAGAHLKKVAETWPDSEFADQALYEWAWCERAQKRVKEAAQLYEQFLVKYAKSPLVAKVQSELAELNIDSGAQDMVIERLTKTMASVTDEALKEDIRYQLATAHYRKKDYGTAAMHFEQLLKDYPKSKLRASMFFQAGESRLRLKETIPARGHFAAGMAIGGIDDTLAESMMMRLGETQTTTGEFGKAQQTYRQFLNRFKESTWIRNAQFGLAWSMENTKNPGGAIGEYAKLLDPKAAVDLWTVRARFQTGECYFNQQNYEKAVSEFLNIEINFKSYPSWQAKGILEIGRVLLAQKRNDAAKERFKDVITRYPKEKAAVVARQYLEQLRTQ